MKQIQWAVFAASFMGLALTAGGAFANHYPEATQMQTSAASRSCTQLELSAGVDRSQCGTLTVAQVIEQMLADQDD